MLKLLRGQPAGAGIIACLCAVGVCLLAGWLLLMWQQDAAHHDIFWLYTGFLRLQSGQSMVEVFYETNPPLSIYIYTPAFWLTQAGIFSLPHAILIYTTALLAAALAAGLYAARTLKMPVSVVVMTGGLLLCGTVLAGSNYGQRDHYVALAALPLLLLLWGRTQTPRPLNKVEIAILVIGTMFLLLKPYYGLLPAYLMLHRAYVQKRITALWDADFMVMAGTTLLYAFCIYFFFRDYVTQILPAVLDLYVDSGWRYSLARLALLASAWCLLLGLSSHRRVADDTRALARQLLIFAAFSLLIYLLMMKGYDYHLLPCLTFLYLAGLYIGHDLFKPWVTSSTLCLLLMVLPLALICLLRADSFIPHKRDVERQALTQRIAACTGDCPFLMIGSTLRIAQLISYYTDQPHASRFAKTWFAEGMREDGLDIEKATQQRDRYRHYVDMITADILLYKPRMIFSCDYYADLMPWLSTYDNFTQAFALYRKTSEVKYDHDIFHHGKSARKPRIVTCVQYDRRGS